MMSSLSMAMTTWVAGICVAVAAPGSCMVTPASGIMRSAIITKNTSRNIMMSIIGTISRRACGSSRTERLRRAMAQAPCATGIGRRSGVAPVSWTTPLPW